MQADGGSFLVDVKERTIRMIFRTNNLLDVLNSNVESIFDLKNATISVKNDAIFDNIRQGNAGELKSITEEELIELIGDLP